MWAYNSIFYQIYPIGFCGAPVHNDGVCVPRIRKLMDWSEYLQTLGVDSILLNPIFESDNHGYDTRDFKTIDCRLGTNEDFKEVCEDLHKHNVKIVLDGVFNHVGRGFWAFKDVQEKKWDSPYKDWFHISFDGNSCYNDGFWYEGWEGHFELVKLNLQNPAVVDYLMECVKYWIDEFDIDGLRLDVAYSLDHNIATAYIRPQRYTKKFMDETGMYTLSFLSEDYRKALSVCGSVSGKDVEDKWKEAGLHPYAVDGTTAVEEADLIFVCKTQYTQDMKPECFDVKENDEKWYPDKDYHTMYMGEIVKVLKRV